MAFADKSTTGARSTGYRIATKRNKRLWGGYQGPGVDAGGTFGAGHQTGQESRPAAWLPIKELNKETDLHIRQYPIVMYAGTICGLESDGLDTWAGGDTLNSTATGSLPEFNLVPATGGCAASTLTETALAQADIDNGVRTKGASVQTTAVSTTGSRVAVLRNKPIGILMKDGYQNTTNVYNNFELQGDGLTCLLRGWAHYPYGARHKVGSDAQWAVKRTFADTNTATGETATIGDIALTGSDLILTITGNFEIIKEGPLATDLTVQNTTSDVDITHLIDWPTTKTSAGNVINFKTDPGTMTDVTVICWVVRTAMVTAASTASPHTITVNDEANLLACEADDVLVDETGARHVVASVSSNVITVDSDPTGTVSLGGRITMLDDDNDSDSIWGAEGADSGIAAGDYVQAGQWGQPVKWDAKTDDPAQKIGRAFFVEQLSGSISAYSRNAGYRPQTPTSFDLVGSGTDGLPAHIYDEFGASSTATARGMWICFDVK